MLLDSKLIARLKSNDPNIFMIDFSYQSITDKDIVEICSALSCNTYVDTLILNATLISDSGVKKIATLLRKNDYLKRIELSNNKAVSCSCLNNFLNEFKLRFYNKNGFRKLALNPYKNAKEIDEAYDLTPEKFIHDYVKSNRPLIVRGGIKNTVAFEKWSPDYFINKVGLTPVELSIIDLEKEQINHYFSRISKLYMKMYQAVSLIEDISGANSLIKRLYLQEYSLEHFPEIKEDIPLPEFTAGIQESAFTKNLWFGQRDTRSPLHFDSSDNLFMQIYGEKSVLLYAPIDSKFLFQSQPRRDNIRHPIYFSNIPNIDVLDEFYEVSQQATPYCVKLNPGDILFIPQFWWHEVKSLFTSSISVNYWFEKETVGIPEVEELIKFNLKNKETLSEDMVLPFAELMLKHNEPNYVIINQVTILQMAVFFNIFDAARLLLAHPAIKPNLTGKCNTYTPLFIAIKFGYIDMLNLLLEHKDININTALFSGYLPLTLAAEAGHLHIIQRLITAGAVPNARDSLGRTALDLAIKHDKLHCVSLLSD